MSLDDDPDLREIRRDLAAEPVPGLQITSEGMGQSQPWAASADGRAVGLGVDAEIRGQERLVEVAGRVQEAAVKTLWARGESAVWPTCPRHPGTHPLTAQMSQAIACWLCPKDNVTVCVIGQLPVPDGG